MKTDFNIMNKKEEKVKLETIEIPEEYKEIFQQKEQLWADINTDIRRLAGTLNAVHQLENEILGKMIKNKK